MFHDDIVAALNNLVPDAKWQLTGDDYGQINWIEGDKPTLKEIQDEINNIPLREAEKKAEKEIKKNAAEAKLIALGLTIDDIKALGLG